MPEQDDSVFVDYVKTIMKVNTILNKEQVERLLDLAQKALVLETALVAAGYYIDAAMLALKDGIDARRR